MAKVMISRGKVGDSLARQGFTLVEVLVVMGVIAVLVGIVLGVQGSLKSRAMLARAEGELASLVNALEQFKSTYGDYPWIQGDTTGSQDFYAALLGMRNVKGRPFVSQGGGKPVKRKHFIEPSAFSVGMEDQEPVVVSPEMDGERVIALDDNWEGHSLLDPWGKPYRYYYKRVTGSSQWKSISYVLYSAGPDGQDGLSIPADGILREPAGDGEARDNLIAQ